jgi:hypothetical protein
MRAALSPEDRYWPAARAAVKVDQMISFPAASSLWRWLRQVRPVMES